MSESSSADQATITTKFNEAVAGRYGIRVSVRDKVRAEAILLKLEPSYVLLRGEWLDLIYLLEAGERADGKDVVEEVSKDNDDEVVVAFDVGSLDDGGVLHTADAEALMVEKIAEEAFHRFKVVEVAEKLFPPDVTVLSADGVTTLNDAEVHGKIPTAIREKLIRASRAKGRDEKVWKTSPEFTFGVFLDNYLTKHTAGKKDGWCFVPGALIDGKRSNPSVEALYMMGLDVDSGESLDETFKIIQRLGLFAVVYTTHSHLSTLIEIKQDKFFKWATDNDKDTDPSDESVKEFLTKEGKYHADVIASARYVTTKHEVTGIVIKVQTRPIDKFRIVFLLDEPYVIAKQKMSQKDAIQQWRELILGLAKSLGIKVDRAATDCSRLFYEPRHAEGTDFKILVNAGKKLLDWRKIKKDNGKGSATSDPFDQAAHIMGGRVRERTMSPTLGLDLQSWAAESAAGFMPSTVFQEYCPENIRRELNPSKFVVLCPFDDDHSNPGDPDDQGCYIEDAGEAETFSFRCSHDSCRENDRLKMLEKAMSEGWFPDDVLTDSRYSCLVVEDEEEEGDTVDHFIKATPGHAAKGKPDPITKEELKLLHLLAEGPKRNVALGKIKAKALAIAKTFNDATLEDEYKGLIEQTLALSKTDASAVDKVIGKGVGVDKADIRKLRKIVAASANKSDNTSGLDENGWIEFSEKSEFYVGTFEGRNWIYKKGESDRRMCQHFKVSRVATDIGGKSQHLTIMFPSPEGDMAVTLPRGDLPTYAKIGQALLDAGFACTDVASVSGILMPLAFAANALLIERTGFAYGGNAFLRPDGRTVRHEDRKVPDTERPYLQSPGADRPSHLFTAGTKEGYIAAIRPAFLDASGKTRKPDATGVFDPGPFPNVSLMALAAAAGAIHTYANPLDGVLLASIVAGSGSIKTIGAEVYVAGSGNPTSSEAGFFTWDATKTGLEVRLPRISACNLALDELRLARQPEQVEMMLWMLFAGKGGVRSNNNLGEPPTRVFGGVAVITSEELLADYFKRNKITPPPGFDARVVSIRYTREMIPNQTGNAEAMEIIKGFHTGARANYGHAAAMAVDELLRMTADDETSPERLGRILMAYRDELAAMVPDRQTMDSRAADLFATFRYSGELLQRLGFIPADYDVKALIEWTWNNCRVGVREKKPGSALIDRLRATILANGDRIPEWDKLAWYANSSDDYRGAMAWRSTKKVAKVNRNIIMITEDKLSEIVQDLTGGVTDLIEEIEKIGALIPYSDSKTHRQRNNVPLIHYQIDADKLLTLKEGDEGYEEDE